MNKTTNPFATFALFISLAYGISWVFWLPAAGMQGDLMSLPTLLLHTLGGFGPSLAGIMMVYRLKDRQAWQDFWRRTVDFRQVGLKSILLILLFFPLLAFASIGLSYLVGGQAHSFPTIARIAAQPGLLLGMLLAGLIAGPIPEELGWRGFALDVLQARLGGLRASLILGIFWWAWHLPLFWIQGTTQSTLGIGTFDFWVFMLTPLPLSALFTWVYNQTRGSILSAILMHLGFNFSTNLLYPLSVQATVIHLSLLLILTGLAYTLPQQKPSGQPGRQLSWWRR